MEDYGIREPRQFSDESDEEYEERRACYFDGLTDEEWDEFQRQRKYGNYD